MKEIFKSSLLVLNKERTSFLVVKKNDPRVPDWIMPGGKIEAGETPEEALVREIREELQCDIEIEDLRFVNDYTSPAAGTPEALLHTKLFQGTLLGEPRVSAEIKKMGWLTAEDMKNAEASETIRAFIIPDLIAKGILL